MAGDDTGRDPQFLVVENMRRPAAGWRMEESTQRYALGEKLHQGRRASVYRAVRKADGHKVVLRVLDGNDPVAGKIERLKHELDLRSTLHGLPAVEPLALSTLNGAPALELEDFVGEPLDRLVTAPLPVEDFLPLAVSVAAAVGDIHSRGLIHKDLNPGSILFDPQTRRVKVANFGAASRVAREQTAAGPERLLEESLPYVSPEQTGRMNRAVDSRSDLYSLGVTYYQLLTGRLPFTASDAIGWVHCHVARKPAPPARFRDALPSVLSEIVLKLLAKVPDDRYQSAAGLQRDLERCLRQWRETGTITPFALGAEDTSDRFLVPQTVYGREAECAALREAFERVVATGQPELVLVSGPSGIGKSAVVYELRRPIIGRQGFFLSAKFERGKRDIPYLALIRAFRELALDILTESAEQIAAWRRRIIDALGPNGRLIVDLVPEIELIIGPAPARAARVAARRRREPAAHGGPPVRLRLRAPGTPAHPVPRRSAVGGRRQLEPGGRSGDRPGHQARAAHRRLPHRRGPGRAAGGGDPRQAPCAAAPSCGRSPCRRWPRTRWTGSSPTPSIARRRRPPPWRDWCARRPAAIRSSPSTS